MTHQHTKARYHFR